MKCDHCGKEKDDVEYCVDPYEFEINEELVERYLCEDCYDSLTEDI
jgi:hypothetical protein